MMRHFGVLIPSTNTTVEIEYNRLLPSTLQVHVGRLGKGDNTPFAPSRPDDIAYQARLLGTAQVEVVCLIQTSASLSADEYDATTTRQMTAGAGVPSLTSAQAIGQAVRALGARRIALVSPYSQEVLGRARQYFESRYGVEVVAMEGFGTTDSYAISTISADHATAAFTRVDRPEIEALVVPGGNLGFQAQSPDFLRLAGHSRRAPERIILTLSIKTKRCAFFSVCMSSVIQTFLVSKHDERGCWALLQPFERLSLAAYRKFSARCAWNPAMGLSHT